MKNMTEWNGGQTRGHDAQNSGSGVLRSHVVEEFERQKRRGHGAESVAQETHQPERPKKTTAD